MVENIKYNIKHVPLTDVSLCDEGKILLYSLSASELVIFLYP